MFGDMVDYEAMELIITQEEIAQNLETAAEIFTYYDENLLIKSIDQAEYDRYSGLSEELLRFWTKSPDRFVNVQMPNSDGGVTAMVNAFAAINRNTKHPEEAFKVMELLFSYDTFRNSDFRPEPQMFGGYGDGIATGKNYYGEADLIDTDILEEAIPKINSVRFRSDFDTLLLKTYVELEFAVMNGEEYDIDQMAADVYHEMKMMAAE